MSIKINITISRHKRPTQKFSLAVKKQYMH